MRRVAVIHAGYRDTRDRVSALRESSPTTIWPNLIGRYTLTVPRAEKKQPAKQTKTIPLSHTFATPIPLAALLSAYSASSLFLSRLAAARRHEGITRPGEIPITPGGRARGRVRYRNCAEWRLQSVRERGLIQSIPEHSAVLYCHENAPLTGSPAARHGTGASGTFQFGASCATAIFPKEGGFYGAYLWLREDGWCCSNWTGMLGSCSSCLEWKIEKLSSNLSIPEFSSLLIVFEFISYPNVPPTKAITIHMRNRLLIEFSSIG